ncbi:MAG: hypothetical protein H6865_03110 [Rhodospirillales bacterium]|nr:hypothetical protein [Alphaproteobacteria bacterium]MCB9986607.1 hypothetical protein [Rhodospirillales bacterium]USO06863.1 MAG: hypothetical protein H6866_05275 [Rhodospirillales bacterium]
MARPTTIRKTTSPTVARRVIDCAAPDDMLTDWPVADAIRESDTAMALIADLGDGWMLAGADLDGREWDIDTEDRVITVDTAGLTPCALARSKHFQNLLILRTLGALRAAWQAERGEDALFMHRIDLWPLLGRIVAADTAVMTLRMVHEIRDAGFDAAWRHVLGDDHGDMAAEYVRTFDAAPDDDAPALGRAFLHWFKKPARLRASDFEILALMDENLANLTHDGRGTLGEGAIRCLTIDPLSGGSYLGPVAGEIAGNPAWRSIADPVAEAHFAQIMDEIGTTRVGHVALRDSRLAARLFPGHCAPAAGVDADPDLCVK